VERRRVEFGSFALDVDARRLTCSGVDLHLTPKAFDLLVLLIDAAPRVIPKRDLHDRLWPDTFVSDATLVGLVKEIRRALGDQEVGAIVRTAHRVGYSFAAPVHRPPLVSERRCWIVIGGRRSALDAGENLIGRDPAAAIRIDVPGVSRRHARIVVAGSHATIEDLGSKNGTEVDDSPVIGAVTLHDGSRIAVADVVFVFHESADGVSTETAPRRLKRHR